MTVGTGKGGGGGRGLTQRFSCQQHYGPSTKDRFVREIKGKELRRRSLNSHMHKINKEYASEAGQTLLNEIDAQQ